MGLADQNPGKRPSLESVREIAQEISDEVMRRDMEVGRARMWDRDPGAWTRYERLLSEAVLAALAEEEQPFPASNPSKRREDVALVREALEAGYAVSISDPRPTQSEALAALDRLAGSAVSDECGAPTLRTGRVCILAPGHGGPHSWQVVR